MRDLIRVGYTTLAPFISGAERSLQVMLRHLPAAGVEPVVIGPLDSRMAPWCAVNSVRYVDCPLAFRDKWHPVRWWSSVRRMRRILRDNQIQLIHANQLWCYPAVGVAAARLGLPRVCHLRDELSAATVKWYCRSDVDVAVCISQFVRSQAELSWPADKTMPELVTLPNPVELPTPPAGEDRGQRRLEARRRWQLPDDDVVFGFIGQLREIKGVLELLDTVARLPSPMPWRLLIAGHDPLPGAPYEAECRAKVRRLSIGQRVSFLGHLDNTEAFFDAIDLAVVPSLYEPMGRVPLEAAAHGKPSVAMAVGGLPEVIVEGETGWLAPAGEWNALGAILERFLEQPDFSIGAKARRWVETVAAPQRYASELAALYRRLLASPAIDQQHEPHSDGVLAATAMSGAVE